MGGLVHAAIGSQGEEQRSVAALEGSEGRAIRERRGHGKVGTRVTKRVTTALATTT